MSYEAWCHTCNDTRIILTVNTIEDDTLCVVCDRELEVHGYWSEVAK